MLQLKKAGSKWTAVSWTQKFQTNQNDIDALQFVREAAKQNNFELAECKHPFKWGEDFGLFTQQFKGAMFGIGAGIETPALHNPDYDFPDEIIPVGMLLFHSIAKKICIKCFTLPI